MHTDNFRLHPCGILQAMWNQPSVLLMRTPLRRLLLLVVMLPALCAMTAVAAVKDISPLGESDARHLLERAGFGARPADVAEFARLSRSEAVERLLADRTTELHAAPPAELLEWIPPSRLRELKGADESTRKAFQQEQRQYAIALRGWWLNEMLNAPTPAAQLRERMTLFWHNHFVSSLQKVKSTKLMLEQNLLLRRHALGRFDELLHAVAKDPAMIVYLDSATNRRGSPNENFAREVMELFTLGEGHYSEQDVKQAARAFTGWSIERDTGAYRWRPLFHDDGEKTVLGRSGRFTGDDVLDILLARPETAEFITRKLWREFISPTPDENEVRRIALHFRASHYDIRDTLREVFLSRAFWSADNRASLIKSPVDFVVGAMHDTDTLPEDARPLAGLLRQLGQDLFAPPNVRGWPGGEAWINSSTLLIRQQAIERLLRREPIGRETAAKMRDERYQLK